MGAEPLPADWERLALFVAGRALDSDERALVELVDGRCTRIRERATHARGDHVEQVLQRRSKRVEVDLRTRDALREQRLASEFVGVETVEPLPDRLGGGHSPALLVQAAIRIGVQ